MPPSTSTYGNGAFFVLTGLISHVLFNRFEPRSFTPYFIFLLAIPTALVALLQEWSGIAVVSAISVHLLALTVSTVVYRLSPFHPLAQYPGPLLCRVSRLWAWNVARKGNQHRHYHTLHQLYGTHVRTGPNHLHIRDASAVPLVLGPKGFHKGGRYNVYRLPGGQGSLLHITDVNAHAQRRRLWENAFTTSALKGYQEFLARRIDQLVTEIQRYDVGREEFDLSQWLSFFSFDFMGDLSFGGKFKLMEQGGDPEQYMDQVKMNIRNVELAGAMPWLRPFVTFWMKHKGLASIHAFAKECVMTRQAEGTAFRDLFYYLLDEDENRGEPLKPVTIVADATLLIIAGSETSGTAMSNLFFYLLSHPNSYKRLRDEIDGIASTDAFIFDSGVLAELPYLNAVINETLRLQPGVPNGVQRVPPPGNKGTLIGGRWAPPSTTVQTSTYSVHRDPRYFSPRPESFLPERWLPSGSEHPEDYTLNRSAFFPFSYGPTGCVGKNLALLEMRTVTAALVRKFEFKFAPGWDPESWERNLTDSYVLTKGGMPVLPSLRK